MSPAEETVDLPVTDLPQRAKITKAFSGSCLDQDLTLTLHSFIATVMQQLVDLNGKQEFGLVAVVYEKVNKQGLNCISLEIIFCWKLV